MKLHAIPTRAAFLALTLSSVLAGAVEHGPLPVAVIRGVEDTSLESVLVALSASLWQSPQPPQSEMMLRGRARRHQERLEQALKSEGYYNGTVTFETVWSDAARHVLYDVTPGVAYRFDRIELLFDDGSQSAPPPLHVSPGLKQGDVARAEGVIEAGKRIERGLINSGYPFATIHDRRVLVNHDTATVNVSYFVVPGERMRFGPPRIEGLEKVQPETVLRQIAWHEGALYQADQLRKTQDNLRKTGLFSLVRATPLPPAEAEGDQLPILIEVTERRHRTLSLGLQYRTDEGVGAGGQWEHRNFLGLGRRLRVQSQITELEQSIGATYEIPQFRRHDQALTLHAKAAQLDPDPYRSRRFDVGAWVQREITPEWSLGMGPALRLSRVEERRRTQQYYLASFPVQLMLDRRNDPMDATRGYRAVNRLTPFVDVTNIDIYFAKNELTLSYYLPVPVLPELVLATRLRIGVMSGAGLREIPADERFYSGGGGSIRGYAYQKVGPLDEEGDPTGGRSLTDWSVELRKRLNKNFGLVAFVDGGMAHESARFDFKDAAQWGAGLGLRYFTPIGPLRLDVAVPVNRRKGMDSSMQFYISIGQAF